MKILVICQYYYPEPFRITDICEALAAEGNEVTVVTGTPNYPMGEIYPGYECGKRADETINGVKVHRCDSRPRKTGAVNRLLNYFSYPAEAKKYIKKLDGDFDTVFVYQLSPVMMAEPAVKYKKRYGKRLTLYCLDIWPESLCVGGIKKGSPVYRIFKLISARIYKQADKILISSGSFQSYFEGMFNIGADKIGYLPQYSEEQFLGLREKETGELFELLFAGNIGTAQSVDTIIDAAALLEKENIRFHIVGDGIELERLKKKAENLSNVIFYGRKPIEEMPYLYEKADAMLVTLTKDDIASRTLPGKVQSYMAAGKPIVGAADGETRAVLTEAQGDYCGEAENASVLAENIIKLKNSGQSIELGRKNREYYVKHFSKTSFIERLTEALKENCTGNQI